MISRKSFDKIDGHHQFDHLIVAEDVLALALYKKLREQNSRHRIKIIFQQKYDLSSQIFFHGPCPLRGDVNIDYISQKYPDISFKKVEGGSLFLKDQKLNKFSSKKRSQKLFWGEKFYLEEQAKFSYKKIFPFLLDQSFMKDFAESTSLSYLTQIQKEKDRFLVTCSDGSSYGTNGLAWGSSPYSFYELYENREQLSARCRRFCHRSRGRSSLIIELKFATKVTGRGETLFIPLKSTYEEGHFIGEFEDFQDGFQKACFVTFMDSGETTERDIAKKIKSLKRNLSKIFGKVSKKPFENSLYLYHRCPSSYIQDKLYDHGREKDLKSLAFYGAHAPLPARKNSLSQIARALESLEFF